MNILRLILGMFTRQPLGQELLQIQQDGCMGTDWTIKDRGRIVRVENRGNSWNGRPVRFYIVRRPDGTEFDAIVDRCNHNPDRDCSRLAGEDLNGKIYEGI